MESETVLKPILLRLPEVVCDRVALSQLPGSVAGVADLTGRASVLGVSFAWLVVATLRLQRLRPLGQRTAFLDHGQGAIAESSGRR